MYCDRCGATVEGNANFCPSCGRSFAVLSSPPPRGRVAAHLKTLGILWLVRAGLRLIPGLFLTSFSRYGWWWDGEPPFVPGLLRGIGTFFMLSAIAGAIAGWGLLDRRPWARMLAIILGVLSRLDFPIGTALGIYTLWVLAPSSSETEYQAIANRPVIQ
jgi:zinc-ribbon domain